ncbi:hypothetical protein CFP56_007542 [Quercus suber]|uniref:Uncharacterized protein n=1 Tax=Quercus suber TaxID=58331 RepID=A0AAW0L7F2_QUESU
MAANISGIYLAMHPNFMILKGHLCALCTVHTNECPYTDFLCNCFGGHFENLNFVGIEYCNRASMGGLSLILTLFQHFDRSDKKFKGGRRCLLVALEGWTSGLLVMGCAWSPIYRVGYAEDSRASRSSPESHKTDEEDPDDSEEDEDFFVEWRLIAMENDLLWRPTIPISALFSLSMLLTLLVEVKHLSLLICPNGIFLDSFMYLFIHSLALETDPSSASFVAAVQDSWEQPDLLKKDLRTGVLQEFFYHLYTWWEVKRKELSFVEELISCYSNIKPGNFALLSIKLLLHVIHYTEGGYDLQQESKSTDA